MFFDTSFLKDEEISLVLERTAAANLKRGWVPAYYFAICNKDGAKIGECDLSVGHNENTQYRVQHKRRIQRSSLCGKSVSAVV